MVLAQPASHLVEQASLLAGERQVMVVSSAWQLAGSVLIVLLMFK